MESLKKLEVTFGGWLKDMPHLPVGVRKWIAENAWWLVIISVVLGAFAIMSILGAIALVGTVATVYGGAVVGAALTGTFLLASLVLLGMLILMTVLEAMAIKPLKALQKRGWDLIFLVTLISLVLGIVASILSFDLSGIIRSVLGAAIGYYFLYEVIGYFKPEVKQKASTEKPTVAPVVK